MACGEKTVTIRYDDPIALGPSLRYFEDDDAHGPLRGTVTSVTPHPLKSLTAEQAHLRPGASLESLRAGLRGHYPQMPGDAEVDVVTSTLGTAQE